MQAALEKVRDAAESWFELSVREQDDLREEWSGAGGSAGGIRDDQTKSATADG
jgi:hypothetical protein